MSSSLGRRRSTGRGRVAAALLAAGFLAFTAAVLVAHVNPAASYELSPYAGAPAGFWLGVGAAFVLAIAVAWHAGAPGSLRGAAVALAYAAVFAVVALPVLRGYHFVGAGDSLTHLGWVADIAAGRLAPAEFLYPGVHTTALFVSHVTGVAAARALEYVVLAYAGVYLAFVPLCVRAVTDSELGFVVGAFAALPLLPVNNVSVHLMTHPTTQALLLLPLQLFLLFHYLVRPRGERAGRLRPTAVGVLLALTSAAMVLVHPQTALNVVVVFATVAAVQFLYRRYEPHHAISRHRPMYAQTAFVALAFGLWAPRNERVGGTVQAVLDSLVAGANPGAEVTQRGTSLTEVGGSLPELFVKLFGPSLAFSLLAGAFVLALVVGRADDARPDRNAFATYLAASLVPLTAAFLLFFALSVSTQHFRYTGFIMVVVTVLGAAGLTAGLRWLGGRRRTPALRAVAAAFFVVVVPFAVATVYPSPFIYQPSAQVTEMSVEGHSTAFERRAADTPLVGVRGSTERYLHAHYGTERATDLSFPWARASTDDEEFDDGVADDFEVDTYVAVTRRDYLREVALYDGFRYSDRGFQSLTTTPRVNRVVTNGEFQLYRVDS